MGSVAQPLLNDEDPETKPPSSTQSQSFTHNEIRVAREIMHIDQTEDMDELIKKTNSMSKWTLFKHQTTVIEIIAKLDFMIDLVERFSKKIHAAEEWLCLEYVCDLQETLHSIPGLPTKLVKFLGADVRDLFVPNVTRDMILDVQAQILDIVKTKFGTEGWPAGTWAKAARTPSEFTKEQLQYFKIEHETFLQELLTAVQRMCANVKKHKSPILTWYVETFERATKFKRYSWLAVFEKSKITTDMMMASDSLRFTLLGRQLSQLIKKGVIEPSDAVSFSNKRRCRQIGNVAMPTFLYRLNVLKGILEGHLLEVYLSRAMLKANLLALATAVAISAGQFGVKYWFLNYEA